MKNILVTIDFENKIDLEIDKNIILLIDKAVELAQSMGSKIWLLHIAAPEPDFVGYDVGPQNVRDSRAKELRKEHKLLQDYAHELKIKGIDTEAILVQGVTTDMIISESKKLNIDMIIAGHHEHGFIYKTFVEDVSAEIINKSKIPVLIVPFE